MSLANQLDWVAKYRMINAYRERHGLSWQDPKLAAMDLQYHDVNPKRSLYARMRHGTAPGSRRRWPGP